MSFEPEKDEFKEQRERLRIIRSVMINLRRDKKIFLLKLEAVNERLQMLGEEEIELQRLWTPIVEVKPKARGKKPFLEITDEEFVEAMEEIEAEKR